MDHSDKNISEDSFSVHKPRSLVLLCIIVGIIGAIFSCSITVLMIIFPNDTADMWVYLIFIAFILLSFFLVLIGFLFKRWEIRIDGRQLRYTPFIGNTEQFTFESFSRVQSISHSGWVGGIAEIKFYVADKNVFTVGSTFRGFNKLLSCLNNENIEFS